MIFLVALFNFLLRFKTNIFFDKLKKIILASNLINFLSTFINDTPYYFYRIDSNNYQVINNQ